MQQQDLFNYGGTGRMQRKQDTPQPPIPPGEWKKPRSWYEVLQTEAEMMVCGLYEWHACERVVPVRGRVGEQISEADMDDSGCVAVLRDGRRLAVETPKAFIIRQPERVKLYWVER